MSDLLCEFEQEIKKRKERSLLDYGDYLIAKVFQCLRILSFFTIVLQLWNFYKGITIHSCFCSSSKLEYFVEVSSGFDTNQLF